MQAFYLKYSDMRQNLYKITEAKNLPDVWFQNFSEQNSCSLQPWAYLEPYMQYFSLDSQQLQAFRNTYEAIQKDQALNKIASRISFILFSQEHSWDELFSWPAIKNMPLFYLVVLMQQAVYCIEYWKEKGISDDILLATFNDIPLWLNRHKNEFGCYGIIGVAWLQNHFSCGILRIGRLQFMPSTFYWEHIQKECGLLVDDPVLDIHIPGDGPLSEAPVRASIAEAKNVFKNIHPDVVYKAFTCRSWLFDTQLNEYLSESSNIIRFQKMFDLYDDPNTNSEDIIAMVLGEPYRHRPLDFTPSNSLERAIVEHIKKGGRWGTALGILK